MAQKAQPPAPPTKDAPPAPAAPAQGSDAAPAAQASAPDASGGAPPAAPPAAPAGSPPADGAAPAQPPAPPAATPPTAASSGEQLPDELPKADLATAIRELSEHTGLGGIALLAAIGEEASGAPANIREAAHAIAWGVNTGMGGTVAKRDVPALAAGPLAALLKDALDAKVTQDTAAAFLLAKYPEPPRRRSRDD